MFSLFCQIGLIPKGDVFRFDFRQEICIRKSAYRSQLLNYSGQPQVTNTPSANFWLRDGPDYLCIFFMLIRERENSIIIAYKKACRVIGYTFSVRFMLYCID